ncbi:MAG: DUF4321 domain-containing protein [Candidatus Omnitrophota bacterium]
MKKGVGSFLLLLLVSALIGSAVGEIIGVLVGSQSAVYQFFTATAIPSFGPGEINLIFLKLTFGIQFRLNLMALLGMIGATIYYLKFI